MKDLLEQRHKEAELIFGKTIFPRESIEDEDVKAMEKIISFHDQTVLMVLENLNEQIVRGNTCQACGGQGQEIIGENRVTLDMAIDAGDRSMEGAFHSLAYGNCENCAGSGVVEMTQQELSSLLTSSIEELKK